MILSILHVFNLFVVINLFNYIMEKTKRKIIGDEAIDIVTPVPRKKINNQCLLSGGGVNQTFFSMGSIKCLVDNKRFYDKKTNKFYFDVISAVSGGTIILAFLDLATNPQYNYHLKDDWYNIYIRKPIHDLARSNILKNSFKNNFDLEKISQYIFDTIKYYNLPLTNINTNIICDYYYVDAIRNKLSCNHEDLINLSKGIKVPYWYLIRLSRCCLPLTNFYDQPTFDGALTNNIPIINVVNSYDSKNCIIIAALLTLTYDYYPKITLYKQLINVIGTSIDSSNSSINSILLNLEADNVICCSMSNSFKKSKDPVHKNLFYDYQADIPTNTRYYNGVLFCYLEILKVIENEGYAQMYHELKKKNPSETLVFDIPNPEVYDKQKARKIVANAIKLNFFPEIVKSFF